MSVDISFPVEQECDKPFLEKVYVRRMEDGQIEIGVANRRGYDYAWAVISPSTFAQAAKMVAPEEFTNA